MFANLFKKQMSLILKSSFLFAIKKKDLYQILGIQKSASQSQIKKAYYKLAQQLHPDKNSTHDAKDKFAEINNAYEVLSDQEKRQTYDRTGSTQNNPYSGFQNQDIFNNFSREGRNTQNMGGFQDFFQNIFGGFGGHKGNRSQNNFLREDIVVKLDIEFKEAVNGIKKNVQYKKQCICTVCNGTRAKPGSKAQKCSTCQGSGYMTIRQGMMIFKANCTACDGQGVKITNPCVNCKGVGIQPINTNQQINIPRGIADGATLKFKGKGNLGGDLVVRVNVKKHATIKREGNDAISQLNISIIDAVLGCNIEVTTIYDQKKGLTLQSGIQNGQKVKIAHSGFYKINSTEKGNHIVVIKIKTPKKISQEQKILYEKLKNLKGQKL